MDNKNTQSQYCWDELSPEEVLALLQQLAGQGQQAISGFVDTHQWAHLSAMPGVFVEGGYEQAQFRRVSLECELLPVRYLRLEASQLPDNLHTAKQLRAWLYRNGMPNGTLGDIIVGNYAALVVDSRIETSAMGLPFSTPKAWHSPEVQPKRSTAASRRADAVIATAFGISRGEAQTAIEYGFVFAGFQPLLKRTREISTGEQLVYRTKGRAAILDLETNPRSGRVWVSYKYFPS